MTTYLIIIIANILIGGMIGLTGVAGFLLPILYSGFMGMPTAQALALSFFAFLISGVLGAWNYYKAKNLDLRLAVMISLGSLIGAVIGVRLNLLIDEAVVKKILYTVVLLSGISILLMKDNAEAAYQQQLHDAATSGTKLVEKFEVDSNGTMVRRLSMPQNTQNIPSADALRAQYDAQRNANNRNIIPNNSAGTSTTTNNSSNADLSKLFQ